MSVSSVLLVAATIIAVEGSSASIELGEDPLLEPGDTGQAFYELVVNGETRRIDVGTVTVASVDDGRATLTAGPGATLRPGYQVEFRLPVARKQSGPAPSEPAAPAASPAVSEAVEPSISPPLVSGENTDEGPVRDEPVPGTPVREDYPELTLPPVPVDPVSADVPVAEVRDTLTLASGRYFVGLEPAEAEFFNQTPRHEVRLQGFAIDRSPAAAEDGTPLTGLTYDRAQAHCRAQGLRLPTEAEWEVAARAPGFTAEPDLFEWTASWYEPYPGNTRSEEAYGASHRVLRRLDPGSPATLYFRQYMAPDQSNPNVGFRCVRDAEARSDTDLD